MAVSRKISVELQAKTGNTLADLRKIRQEVESINKTTQGANAKFNETFRNLNTQIRKNENQQKQFNKTIAKALGLQKQLNAAERKKLKTEASANAQATKKLAQAKMLTAASKRQAEQIKAKAKANLDNAKATKEAARATNILADAELRKAKAEAFRYRISQQQAKSAYQLQRVADMHAFRKKFYSDLRRGEYKAGGISKSEEYFQRLKQAEQKLKSFEYNVEAGKSSKYSEGSHLERLRSVQALKFKANKYKSLEESLPSWISRNSLRTAKGLDVLGLNLSRVASAVGQLSTGLSALRTVASSVSGVIGKIVTPLALIGGYAGADRARRAFELNEKLELSNIGFKNFFGADKVGSINSRIRREALNSPSNIGDISDYVRGIAPLVKGNSDLAIDSVLGMMKSIAYYGGDITENMGYLVQNMRDVISKGKATVKDIQQFKRAVPGFTEILKDIGDKTLLDDNEELTIDRQSAQNLLLAFAKAGRQGKVSNIFSDYTQTFSGLKEKVNEFIDSELLDMFKNSGAFEYLKEVMSNIANGSSGVVKLKELGTKAISNAVERLKNTNWHEVGQIITDVLKTIGGALADVKKTISASLGGVNARQTIKRLMDVVAEFIRGMGDGAKLAIDMFKQFEKTFGSGAIKTLFRGLGVLGSPFALIVDKTGRMVQTMLAVSSTMIKGFADLNRLVSQGAQMLAEKASDYAGLAATGHSVNPWKSRLLKGAGIASAIGAYAVRGLGAASFGLSGGLLTSTVNRATGGNGVVGAGLGGVTGALVGSQLLPGFGTAIGAVVGALWGLHDAAKKSAEAQREERQARLDKAFSNNPGKIAKLLLGEDAGFSQYISSKLKNAGLSESEIQQGMKVLTKSSEAYSSAVVKLQEWIQNFTEVNKNPPSFEAIGQKAEALIVERIKATNFTKFLGKESFNQAGGGAVDLNNPANYEKIFEIAKRQGAISHELLEKQGLTIETWVKEKFQGLRTEQLKMIEEFDKSAKQTADSLVSSTSSFITGLRNEYTRFINEMRATPVTIPVKLQATGAITPNLPDPFTVPGFNIAGKKASGGVVYKASGGRGVDTVPAYLMPGEYVVKASSVRKFGLGTLEAINRGDVGYFARQFSIPNQNNYSTRTFNSTANDFRRSANNTVVINNNSSSGALNAYYGIVNRLAS